MRKKEAHILIIDDDDDILFSARVWLKKFFTEVSTLNHPHQIHEFLQHHTVDVVVLDMNFRKGNEEGKEGLYWMEEIQQLHGIPTVAMTAFGEVSLAVEALKKGAVDFILKPWNNEKLYASVNIAVEISRKNKKLSQWTDIQSSLVSYQLESHSPMMQDILNTLKKVAPTDANVLLLGENGTGKYVLAEYVMQHSKRMKEPFVHIDLGALSENLFEAELFGYAKGAFTDAKTDKAGKLENANGGTVFLDEIGNLTMALQQKLLSVIQSKKVCRIGETKERHLDLRFIFATNAPLQDMIQEQRFREDLYFRINTVEIAIPALRNRKEDIPALVQFFVEKFQKKYQKFIRPIENYDAFLNYSYPGNIRELEHGIERAIIMSEDGEVQPQFQEKKKKTTTFETLNLEEMEEKMIKTALKKFQGNISLAAEALGLSRAALYRRMEKFGL